LWWFGVGVWLLAGNGRRPPAAGLRTISSHRREREKFLGYDDVVDIIAVAVVGEVGGELRAAVK
jgi:hypothetical protein